MASTQLRNGLSAVRRRAGQGRRWFRRWRRSRPFWGGLFSAAGGAEILLVPLVPLPILIHEGIAGISGLLMGALMVMMGLSMWFAPQLKGFAGIATLLFSLASFVTSNFGGLLIGMLLGIVGGALGVAWVPVRRADGAESPQPQPQPQPQPAPADGGTASAQPDGGGAPTVEPTVEAPVVEAPAQQGEGGAPRFPLLSLVVAAGLTALAVGPAAPPRAAAAEAPVVNVAVPHMHAETADMSSLSYDGVVDVTTVEGPLRTLKFSMSSVVMHDYTLDVPQVGQEAGAMGITIGTLTLQSDVSFYTTRMSGLLDGIPVTFTPDTPPLAVESTASFTDFRSEQVFVQAGTLDTDGGLHLRSGDA